MPVLLVIVVPLAALLIYAVVFDLRRRRRLGPLKSRDINSAVDRARADTDARTIGLTGGGGGVGGV